MSISQSNQDDADFLHFYQKLKFQEDTIGDITTAGSRRTQLVLNYYQSLKNNEQKATCYLLKNDLDEYTKIVDDKNRLNNYAQYVKSVCSLSRHPVLDYKKWSSSLKNPQLNSVSTQNYFIDGSSTDESATKNIFFDIRKKFEGAERKVNSEILSNKEKLGAYGFQNTNHFSKQSTETSSFNKPVSKLNSGQTNFNSKPYNSSKRFEENETNNTSESSGFRTAKTELKIQNIKKFGNRAAESNPSQETFSVKRSLGGRPRTVHSKFVPPIKNEESEKNSSTIAEAETYEDERLKNLDPKMIELIKNEIMDHGSPITWDDIAGLQFAKTTIQEIVVWPLLRPDIFTGLRRPPKGILLFGPPGTGKTLIGKCIASQSSSTFFSISASSLTSKWIGDSEKLVRTLFAVARCYQPAVIFIDEIDSLLSQRSETEHESSRRIKTEFLVQLDGATTHDDDRILVIGATNRPQELDEAARRRLVKRLYIPLPEFEARCQIVNRLMKTERNVLTEDDVREIAELTDGYSGADMKNLCQEASLGPIRSIDFNLISSIESHEVRPVSLSDFITALKVVRSSVSPNDLNQYLEWDKVYGSSGN